MMGHDTDHVHWDDDVQRIFDKGVPDGFGVIYEYHIPSLCKSYIGQTTNLYLRHSAHLNRGKLSPYIREGDFRLQVLEIAPVEKLDRRERWYIRCLQTICPDGLNAHPGGRLDMMFPQDFSERMEWTFADHSERGCPESFSAYVELVKGRLVISIPSEVVRRMHLMEGDLMDIGISYVKVYQ